MSIKNIEKLRSGSELKDFTDYCVGHPDERFWQALRNWSEFEYIFASNKTVENTYDSPVIDTYYIGAKVK